MAFNADDRVRVTDQSSQYRGKLGTVEIAEATVGDGYNRVRIDGHPVGNTVLIPDNELAATNFTSPITY